jgi:enoyl-CoA hydratase/carnithine racemase
LHRHHREATLVHGAIPIKKVALMQLVGRNISGADADRWGIISRAVDPTAHVESYLNSQKGGPNLEYKRPDV